MATTRILVRNACAVSLATVLWLHAGATLAQTAAPDGAAPAAQPTAPATHATAPVSTVVAQAVTAEPAATANASVAAKASPINGADTAWMLISTVLVVLVAAVVPVGESTIDGLVPVAIRYIAVQVVCAAAVLLASARSRPTVVEVVSP
jgi:hypothetical protein